MYGDHLNITYTEASFPLPRKFKISNQQYVELLCHFTLIEEVKNSVKFSIEYRIKC